MKAREAATLRLYGAGAAPKKFARLAAQQVDGVLRDQYRFAGAGQTGRITGRGSKSRTLRVMSSAAMMAPRKPRSSTRSPTAAATPRSSAADPVDVPVARKLALLVRPALVAAPGKVFVWSDW